MDKLVVKELIQSDLNQNTLKQELELVLYKNENILLAYKKLKELLNKKGAVSSEVALEMAKGVRERFNTDIGVSTTGISGPGGGSKAKPLGLIYMAIITHNKKIVNKYFYICKIFKGILQIYY